MRKSQEKINFSTNKIRAKLIEKGMLQSELAKELGISTQTLNKKLNGNILFNAYEIYKINKFKFIF